MSVATVEEALLSIAQACAEKGPGWAQEGVVLREIREQVQPRSLAEEQQILNAWQQLFRDHRLAWGHDLDNPGHPFFRIVDR